MHQPDACNLTPLPALYWVWRDLLHTLYRASAATHDLPQETT